MQKQSPTSSDTTTVAIRVDTAQLAKLRTLAEREYRSLNKEVCRLIDLRIAEAEDDTKAAA